LIKPIDSIDRFLNESITKKVEQNNLNYQNSAKNKKNQDFIPKSVLNNNPNSSGKKKSLQYNNSAIIQKFNKNNLNQS
jgi:hypothetical protein